MTLSIGPATDYLVATARTAVTGLTLPNSDKWQVIDGGPSGLTNFMFVVGVTEPPPDGHAETAVTREWKGLGRQTLEEDYTIPCYIDARLGGTDQKAVRDIAETAFNAFWPLLKADMSLGGALHEGRSADIEALAERPENLGTVAEPARRLLLLFGVHCRNLTI